MDKNKATDERREDDAELDLLPLVISFLRRAKKLWWLFVLLLAAGVGLAYGASFLQYTPLYRCEATFTVATGGENDGFYFSANAADQMSKTFPYVLDSGYFRSVLLDALGETSLNGTITAQTIENSNMVTMTVTSPSAEDARSILEAALTVYPEVSRFVLGDIELHLIDDIQTPTSPYNVPSLSRLLIMGAMAGFVIAALITLLVTLLNNTITTPEDMARYSSLECLGILPYVEQKARKNSAASRYISVSDPRTPYGFRESIHSLTVRLRTAMQARKAVTLLVTSCLPGEGKSTVAINLAEQLAQEGKRVLLIDFDLRSQADEALLGVKGGITVGEALRDSNLLEEKLLRYFKQPGFFFWGGATRETNPGEILHDPRLKEIFPKLSAHADYLILDTPPCGMFQDAAVLSEYADASLLVVRHDTVTGGNVTDALSLLDATQAPVIGYVFNAYPQTVSHYGYERYGYGRSRYGRYGRYGSYGAYGYGYGEKPASTASDRERDALPARK